MVELHNGNAVFVLDRLGETDMTVEMFVAKNTQLPGKPLTYGLHMRSTRHGQTELTLGTHGQPVKFFIRQASIRIALRIGQRSQHKSVFHLLTGLKLQRLIKATVRLE